LSTSTRSVAAAHLPGAEEPAEDCALRRLLEVRVGADDHRAVAARLDQRALQPGGADDLLRRRVRADEADAVDVLVRDKSLADLAAAVDDAVRQARIRHHLHDRRGSCGVGAPNR
jgi:hypothetical protein